MSDSSRLISEKIWTRRYSNEIYQVKFQWRFGDHRNSGQPMWVDCDQQLGLVLILSVDSSDRCSSGSSDRRSSSDLVDGGSSSCCNGVAAAIAAAYVVTALAPLHHGAMIRGAIVRRPDPTPSWGHDSCTALRDFAVGRRNFNREALRSVAAGQWQYIYTHHYNNDSVTRYQVDLRRSLRNTSSAAQLQSD